MALNFLNIFHKKQLSNSIDDTQNPWIGLSAYPDPLNCKHAKWFCGRDVESFDVSQFIKKNLFVTLYGKSGNGKTSLLNAGVSPRLRSDRFIPINIRLGVLDNDETFQQHIISAIEANKEYLQIKKINTFDEIEDNTAIDFLWNYFARHFFYNTNNELVSPVFILDQFEEVLQERPKDASILLKQLSFLMSEKLSLSDKIIDRERYEYSFNFRFVISIREEDLYLLDDIIAYNHLSLMTHTRYRLRSITKDGAKDLILIPGKDLFRTIDREKIVETIVEVAKGEDNTINVSALSLACNHFYQTIMRQQIQKPITFEIVKKMMSDNPLEQFYLNSTKDLTSDEKAYLENTLVDNTWHRNYVSTEKFVQAIKNGEQLLSGSTPILLEHNDNLALVSDAFCPIIEQQKTKRTERRKNIIENLILFFVSILVVCSINFYPLPFLKFEIGLMLAFTFVMFSIGIIHKSHNPVYSLLGFVFSTLPLALTVINSDKYTISTPFLLTSFILMLYAIISLFCTINNKTNKQHLITFSRYFEMRKFIVWMAIIILCDIIISQTTEPYSCLLLSCFVISAIINIKSIVDIVMICASLLVLCILFFFPSDVHLYVFHFHSMLYIVGALFVIYLGYSIFVKKDKVGFMLLSISIYGIYFLTYKYKFWTLLILTLFYIQELIQELPKGFSGKTKVSLGKSIIISIFIFVSWNCFIGYNTYLIKGVNPTIQVGNWRLKTVISESDNKYILLNALTGDRIIASEFDGIDSTESLYALSKYKFESINNMFLNKTDSALHYHYSSDFEYNVYQQHLKDSLWASTYCKYRDLLICRLIDGEELTFEQYPTCIDTLIKQETESIFVQQNKYEISRFLCKALASSLLKNASAKIDTTSPNKMNLLLKAFDSFAKTHTNNVNWDNSFEEVALLFRNIGNEHLKDDLIPTILPMLIETYKNDNNYNFKVKLYSKIYRLNQIAINHQLPNYLDSLTVKNPFE